MNSSVIIKYLQDIDESVNQLKKKNEKIDNNNYVIAYRGEGADYGKTRLMPTIFRDDRLQGSEKTLLDLLCDYGIVDKSENANIGRAIESQHYLQLSRLLDITFSVLPSLYFCCNSSPESDGFVYIFCFPEFHSPSSTFIEDYYSLLINTGGMSPFPGNFKVLAHGYNNIRMVAQNGGFVLFPSKDYKPISNCYYKSVRIKSEDKKEILKNLEDLFHIYESSLFPEKDKLVTLIKTQLNSSAQKNNTVSYEMEFEAIISRIEYELLSDMYNEFDKNNKITVLRKYRKEKLDIIYFLSNSSWEDKKVYTEKINKFFIDINEKIEGYYNVR